MVSKVKKYNPLDDETLDQSVAIAQCADALDQASVFFDANRDSDGFLQIANGWLHLAKHMADLQEAGVGVDTSSKGDRNVTSGFRAGFQLPEG